MKRTDCEASVDITVKKVNRNTKRNDDYLSQSPPLAAVIKLNLQHNHSTESADALRYLKLSPQVAFEFEEYFNSGLGPGEAARLHEDKILACHDSHQMLDDASQNPSRRTVYYI